MIEEVHRDNLKNYNLPFVPYIFPYKDSKLLLRHGEENHVTLVQDFNYGNLNFSVKEFLMDWYYSGFPKNLMKTSSETYSNIWRTHIMIDGKKYPLFYGEDYRDRFAASLFSHGLSLEIRSDEDFSETVRELFLDFNPVSVNRRFYQLSHYINTKAWRWFEEERMGRMNWSELNNTRIGDYYGDSKGDFNNIHKIEIYRNVNGDYLWLDMAIKGTGFKNLYYKFEDSGNLFSEVTSINDWKVYLVSEFGPAILRYENDKIVVTVTLPYIEFGDVWKYMDIIEKLNLINKFP
ncbi:hypothetical protein ACNF42_00275 [Cuniculiplasma sp. SKW3]|uniref:hypothetical protein n=1 Tax=Cuniculiplasma sp. SKW3 TaxID=3400170 RepID=UPI003FCF75D5